MSSPPSAAPPFFFELAHISPCIAPRSFLLFFQVCQGQPGPRSRFPPFNPTLFFFFFERLETPWPGVTDGELFSPFVRCLALQARRVLLPVRGIPLTSSPTTVAPASVPLKPTVGFNQSSTPLRRSLWLFTFLRVLFVGFGAIRLGVLLFFPPFPHRVCFF